MCSTLWAARRPLLAGGFVLALALQSELDKVKAQIETLNDKLGSIED